MSSKISLIAEDRQAIGKGAARSLRRNGKIPAVIYGAGKETLKVSLSEHELTKLYSKPGYSTFLMDISLGKSNHQVIPRDVELHPVTDKIEHADFMYVSKDSKVKVLVHLHFLNEEKCIGIKRGGMFNIVKRDIALLCSPDNIPNRIDIDILELDIGQNIHANDIALPEGSIIVGTEQNFTIATLTGRGGKATTEETTESAAK